MPLVTEAWDTASLRLLSQAGADGEGAEQYLRKIVENTQDTHLLALLDKNSETSEWRKIWLFKASDDRWLLLDEEGERLDEPDYGCAAEGFTTGSILSPTSPTST